MSLQHLTCTITYQRNIDLRRVIKRVKLGISTLISYIFPRILLSDVLNLFFILLSFRFFEQEIFILNHHIVCKNIYYELTCINYNTWNKSECNNYKFEFIHHSIAFYVVSNVQQLVIIKQNIWVQANYLWNTRNICCLSVKLIVHFM